MSEGTITAWGLCVPLNTFFFFCNGTDNIVVFTKRYEDFRNLNTNNILWHTLTTLLHCTAHNLKRLHQSNNLQAAKSKYWQRQEWIITNQTFKAQVFPLPYHMGLANPLPWHGEVFPLAWNMLWKTGFNMEWLEQKSTCSHSHDLPQPVEITVCTRAWRVTEIFRVHIAAAGLFCASEMGKGMPMTWGTWVLLSQKSPTIWSYIRGEKFKKRHFSTVFSSYSWFQLKLPGISAYTTLADIEKNLSSYVTFLIGRKPLGVHWELGCQMFWDCWKVQRRNINRLKHEKNNVCSLRLPAHSRDNRILKERRGKGKHKQALTRCQSKAAAFTLTMKKSHGTWIPSPSPQQH